MSADAAAAAPFARLDPRLRVLVTAAAAASTACTAADRPLTLAAHAAAVALAIAAARPRARWLAPRVGLALAWGALTALSRAAAAGDAGPAVAFAGARVAVAIAATLPLAATTSLVALAQALAGLGLPRAFVETTAATARGLVILRDEAERLSRARQLRAPDAGPLARARLYGTLAGTLIARGLSRAERAHLAMTLRGFDGAGRGPAAAPHRTAARGPALPASGVLFALGVALALAGAHLLP